MPNLHEHLREMFRSTPELLQSYEIAFALLSSPDAGLRSQAIRACHSYWRSRAGAEFLAKCRAIAATDPNESVRRLAIAVLADENDSTKNPDLSAFLADLILAETTSKWLRLHAYRALRRIQLGANSQDARVRLALIATEAIEHAIALGDETLRQNIEKTGVLDDMDSATTQQIDYDFVRTFATHGNGRGEGRAPGQ